MNRKQFLVWNFLKSVFSSLPYVWFLGRAWKTIFWEKVFHGKHPFPYFSFCRFKIQKTKYTAPWIPGKLFFLGPNGLKIHFQLENCFLGNQIPLRFFGKETIKDMLLYALLLLHTVLLAKKTKGHVAFSSFLITYMVHSCRIASKV